MSPRAERPSRAWGAAFRAGYAIVRRMAPVVRFGMRRRLPGFGRFVELRLLGRRTGHPRPAILTLLVVDGRWYVGHPNGRAGWVGNLEAGGTTPLVRGSLVPVDVRAVVLDPGPERDEVIRATAWLQPFPASLLYRAARRHILAVGAYYRLEGVGLPEALDGRDTGRPGRAQPAEGGPGSPVPNRMGNPRCV